MIPVLGVKPYSAATVAPSPNHGARKSRAIKGIVLHATADGGNEAAALEWMQSPKTAVSCHLMVSRNGNVIRLVGDQQRAWHCGVSWWKGTSDVNSITLGIEVANRNDGEPFTSAQYMRVAEIAAHYVRQGLSLDDVVSHQAIASDRARDPLGWDWDRFRALVNEQLGNVAAATQDGYAPVIQPRPTPRAQIVIKPKAKPALQSRTLWLNGLTVLATGSVLLGDVLDVQYSLNLDVPQGIVLWVLLGIGVLNLLLRFQTTCPIDGSKM